MLSFLKPRKNFIIFGSIFGALMGGLYAVCSLSTNWIALSGVPLAPPQQGVQGYILQYVLLGAVLGLVSSVPGATLAGVVVGGLTASMISTAGAVYSQWGDISVIRTIIILLYTFLPLAVLFMPLAFLIRRGVDAQVIDPERPYLWARRYLVPLSLVLVVVILGVMSLYPAEIRKAFKETNALVQQGLRATSTEELPVSFRQILNFRDNAIPEYEMYWSENAEEFFGPRPASGEMSQFLIFTQFKNGYRIACVFSATTTIPNCTNQ